MMVTVWCGNEHPLHHLFPLFLSIPVIFLVVIKPQGSWCPFLIMQCQETWWKSGSTWWDGHIHAFSMSCISSLKLWFHRYSIYLASVCHFNIRIASDASSRRDRQEKLGWCKSLENGESLYAQEITTKARWHAVLFKGQTVSRTKSRVFSKVKMVLTIV